MERAEIGHLFPSACKESGSRFAKTNRVYQIDHKIPGKLFKNKRTVSFKKNFIKNASRKIMVSLIKFSFLKKICVKIYVILWSAKIASLFISPYCMTLFN